MTAARYDIVVIGGGIHGVGVAQAAAAAGYRTLVLEQDLIGGATSSRSSKLIHGGLRYLERGDIELVHECLRERELLTRLAPELVRLQPFLIPIYATSRRQSWQIFAGLSLYAVLAKMRSEARFRRLPRADWTRLDGLNSTGLQAVFRYQDGQTDDQALTVAVMNSALELGAQLHIPATFQDATVEANCVRVTYRYGAETRSCEAGVLINAAGPWVNHVIARMRPVISHLQIKLVRGTHIIVPGKLEQGIYYLEAPQDRRPVFVIPWRDQIMVGTTEHVYHGDPGQVSPTDEEQDYLLNVLRHYFPALAENAGNTVETAFAGLRVLPATTDYLNALPRDTILFGDRPAAPRVITIYGGKLTAYRATAEKVIRLAKKILPATTPKADTTQLKLHKAPLRI